jgi:hypothetical protein
MVAKAEALPYGILTLRTSSPDCRASQIFTPSIACGFLPVPRVVGLILAVSYSTVQVCIVLSFSVWSH